MRRIEYLVNLRRKTNTTMLTAESSFRQTLIEQLQEAKSETEVVHIIENSFSELAQKIESTEKIAAFAMEMNQRLNSMNPLLVEDPERWNMIQSCKVHFYRMGCKYGVVKS
jgi:adenosine deaminase